MNWKDEKKREILTIKKDIPEDVIIKMINSNEKLNNYIKDKKVIKKIFVPNKIINLIVK